MNKVVRKASEADLEKLLEMIVQEGTQTSEDRDVNVTPLTLGLGSALKRASDGTVIGPKVVVRASKVKVSGRPH
jgi:hypothetical protein